MKLRLQSHQILNFNCSLKLEKTTNYTINSKPKKPSEDTAEVYRIGGNKLSKG